MSEITLEPCPHCHNKNIDYWNEDEGFFYCGKCGLFGPLSHDKILAADRWNALPRRLRWTKERPTQEGWYWHHIPPAFGSVIEYYDPEIAGPETTGEWAGPIPEPE